MIKPEQIPDEVVEAARRAHETHYGHELGAFTSAIAAALNAWPSAAVCHYTIADNEGCEMVLPLPFPQEAGDETVP